MGCEKGTDIGMDMDCCIGKGVAIRGDDAIKCGIGGRGGAGMYGIGNECMAGKCCGCIVDMAEPCSFVRTDCKRFPIRASAATIPPWLLHSILSDSGSSTPPLLSFSLPEPLPNNSILVIDLSIMCLKYWLLGPTIKSNKGTPG